MAAIESPRVGTFPTEQSRAGAPWKCDVFAYHKMGESGILTREDRVELLNGEIIHMSPIGPFHGGMSKQLNALLTSALGPRAVIAASNPIRLDDFSEPQPDFSILHPRPDFYRSSHPTPESVYLLIEIMDSSASFDRAKKLPRYAQAGIPQVWLIDINAETIEDHRKPAGDKYTQIQLANRAQSVSLEAFPEISFPVAAILG